MNKLLTCLSGTVLLLAATAAMVQADPINDSTLNGYKTGWYPNYYKEKGPLTCPETCKIWHIGAAEHELSMSVNSKQTYVCKYGSKEQKYLYGNQFDSEPLCHVSDRSGKSRREKMFYCLCIAK